MPTTRPRSIPLHVDSGVESPNGMKMSFVKMTPKKAQEILDAKNQDNRSLSATYISKYRTTMEQGEWDPYNGEFIKFDQKGNLIDGQNRLTAIAQLEEPQTVGILEGIHPKSKLKIDMGRTRSDAHLLQLQKIPEGSQKAAIGGMIAKTQIMHERTSIQSLPAASRFIPIGAVARLMQTDKLAMEAAEFALSKENRNRYIKLGYGALGGLYYALIKFGNGKEQALEFLMQLRDATAPGENNPITVLRNRFLAAQNPHTKQSRISRDEAFILAIYAYNLWVEGREIERLKMPSSFPRVKSGPKVEFSS